MKLPRMGIVAFISIAIGIGCACAGRGATSQAVKPAGVYAPDISGKIVEVNPDDYSLGLQLDEPCLSYGVEDRVTVHFSQFLWESSFDKQDPTSVGTKIIIELYPMGRDERYLEAMHILDRNNS